MRTCNSCRARNADHSPFCIRCGAVLDAGERDPAAHTDALPVQPEEIPDDLVNQAATQLGDGQAQAAIENCRRAVALNPRHVEAHVVLAMALEQRGDLQAALEAYEMALSLSPDRPVERQKVALLRLRLGHDQPAPAPRPACRFNFPEWLQTARRLALENPALSAGIGAGLLVFIIGSILLVSAGRAQARNAMRAEYESELQMARELSAMQRYAEATARYASAWKIQPGDAAVRVEWGEAYRQSQLQAQQMQRQMELAAIPKYIPNTTGRNPFAAVPLTGTPPPPAPTPQPQDVANMAQAQVPPPTVNRNPRAYEEWKAPARMVTPAPTVPSGRRDVSGSGNQIIAPVTPKQPDKPATPAPAAAADTAPKPPKGEITIWRSPRPQPKASPSAPATPSGPDAGSLRSRGEQLAREGRSSEAIPVLSQAADAYDDMARKDPGNAAAHQQAAGSCRTRIELLRQGNR